MMIMIGNKPIYQILTSIAPASILSVWIIYITVSFQLFPAVAVAEEITCHSEQSIQGGGSRMADLKLILDRNQIVGIVFNGILSFVEKGNPMAIWLCSVDTTYPEKDHQFKWTTESNITVLKITEKDTDEKSIMKIEKHRNRYKVFFVKMSRYYSGNSEFPKSIVIERGNTHCYAVYGK